MIAEFPAQRLQLKVLLRDVHPAVWRRIKVPDSLSIAELHTVIQLLMGWDDDHLHRFRIHGRDYGVSRPGGPGFGEDATAVPLSWFRFRASERFLYEYDFTAGWQVEVRVEKASPEASGDTDCIPVCIAGREPGSTDGCDGPRDYAERRRDAVGWEMADDMDTVVAVLRCVADRDDAVLADPETFSNFEHAVSRPRSREPFLADVFPRAAINTALRQAFTTVRGSP
jgi:Plasmid pRiA4b ORF-3-like protein